MPDTYKKYVITSIRYVLYGIAFTPLIFSGKFLFPYISARAVYFRVLVEVERPQRRFRFDQVQADHLIGLGDHVVPPV